MRTAAKLMVECLVTEGVKYIFGIPGEENLELIQAIADEPRLHFVVVRHEQGAAFMADVYGRLTGKAGVCLATLGPGATNLVTGVADANLDGAPLVAITGQVSSDQMHLTSHQNLDLAKIFEPITKRTKLVMRPDTVNEIVRLAFKYAEGGAGRMGAAHIDLPVDIAKMQVSGLEMPLMKDVVCQQEAEESQIQMAAESIRTARKPLIFVGNNAVHYASSQVITAFAEKLHIPVVNTMMAKGIVSADNRYSMMTIGIPQRDYVNRLFEEADLVICIGYDLMELKPSKWNAERNHRIMHISNWQADISKYYQCEVQVNGEIDSSLVRLGELLEAKEEPNWAFAIKERFEESIEEAVHSDAFPMKPQRIVADIRKALSDPEDILISDVGAHKMWIGRLYGCYKPETCIISNGFASMGIGVPGAVAAKLVYPERRVLVATGDGGFMMNSQELETAVRLGVNFVVVIFHDSEYGLIKWKEEEQYGRAAFVDFTNPDFVALAEAMHCKGVRVNSAAELGEAIRKGFEEKVPVIIDTPVDYSANEELTAELRSL